MEIRTSPRFEKNYKKLPKRIKEQAKQKERVFRENPFDPRLKTHKLSGKEEGSWAFWINNSYRIKFIFLPSEEVLFLDIGTHDIYK
ncbi:type II toxin-antitoxin system mRNA interferase toxin, RelE/StbE family [Patescibacteria group bacterium]|nr:type II toxin-antitoxin system mRNA interferase toxin, RelE/StbE family [Patescibacteria group bacterium]